MRIFITGATGYIGTALSRRLVEQGHELTALVRATSELSNLQALGVRTFVGDVTDRYSMRQPMSGSDWVVHAAAELDFAAPLGRMRRINASGSENVASLAFKLGVGRFLSVSSIAIFGGSPEDGSASDEESPPELPLPSAYSTTKLEGEEAVRTWAEKGLRVNTVYPSLVYGPPGKKQGANALLRAFLKGRMPAIVGADRRVRCIYLEDLVDGILRVMERAEPGEAHMLTGALATVEEIATRTCELGGVAVPRRRMSARTAGFLTALMTPYYRLRGFRPPLLRDQVRSLGRHWNFDDSKARRELDWHPRSLEAGLPSTVEFILSHG